jgi:hypothetical protein
MRNYQSQTSTFLKPAPGTAEAVELGCTCRLIAHQSGTDEKEPAGMLMELNSNCPLHATAIQPRRTLTAVNFLVNAWRRA